ncbi:hypothetical protein PPYR_13124 [Photinus pyralis]|uniref:Uncharacterized protein n=1 Tax=Photinus pyralis TaxID=7054 RepID=A0A1Y1MQK1_PHOPY|nr:uncharacterized protein LOC116179664 [Photinus pyralis]KAB0793504.1 hypothetical protein PPYR_13124 [Photinus pyralis]
MKLTLAVLCVFIASSSKVIARSVPKTYLEPLDLHCLPKIDKSGLDYNEKGYIAEGNDDVNEMVRCSWSKIGLLRENGEIDLYKLQRTLENHLVDMYDNYVRTYLAAKTISDCENVKGDSVGDTCVKMSNCIHTRVEVNAQRLKEEKED